MFAGVSPLAILSACFFFCSSNITLFFQSFAFLKTIKKDGSYVLSNIIAVRFDNPLINILRINPNPVLNTVNIVCNANAPAEINCKLYNSDGRIVKIISAALVTGINTISADVSGLASGIYFAVISRPNEKLAETTFIKL